MKREILWSQWVNGVCTGGQFLAQRWEDVLPRILVLKDTMGSVRIELIDARDPGPINIHLDAEDKRYLVSLLEATEDGADVRSYTSPTMSSGMVEILGDSWSARSLIEDFDTVIMLLKEFFETGDASREWLK